MNLVSNDILKILNKHVVKDEFKLKIGQLVYTIDFLQAKNPHSVLNSLARVTHIAEGGHNYHLKLLNIKNITRHIFSLVPTNCNTYDCTSQSLDIFCLPIVEELWHQIWFCPNLILILIHLTYQSLTPLKMTSTL